MRWRLPAAQFHGGRGELNRRALRQVLAAGRAAGVIGYLGERPVAWCSIAPRAEFPVLQESELLAAVDAQAVWSISCILIERSVRGRGLSEPLLRAALDFARERGARIVEAYPVEPQAGRIPVAAAWTGLAQVFARVGFVEVVRRAPLRPIMRYTFERAA